MQDSELTCPASKVFVGAWHASDLSGAGWADPDLAAAYFDRRRLERLGWILQRPDGLRGEPFARALHPKAKDMSPNVYLINHDRPNGQTMEPPVVQVVYVPVGDEERSWVSGSWGYDLQNWYEDDDDLRGRLCCGVLFIKSDY